MGEVVEFPSNGSTGQGYIATPENGAESTAGIVVLQEWWGLVDQIKHTCDRLADAGFTALAPDLYHGATVPLTEPDEAGKQMMALKMDTAAKDLSGAVDELVRRTGRGQVGVIGFCMGGGLALVLATQRPDAVAAVVPAYGLVPWPAAQPDYTKLPAAVLGPAAEAAGKDPQIGAGAAGEINDIDARPIGEMGARRGDDGGAAGGMIGHAAEEDDYFTPDAARALESELRELGKDVEFHIYPGAGHAFFNEDRPEAYHRQSAELLWDRTIDFFRQRLG